MRATLTQIARRAYLAIGRGTISKVDDKKLMQEIDIRVLHNEAMTGVEHFHPYGFSAVVLPPDQQQTPLQQQDNGMSAGQPQSKQGKGASAECVTLFVNGDRSHPVVIVVADRRHRIKGMEPGEIALYDDQKQQVHITRDGVVASVPHDKKVSFRIMPPDDQQGSGSGKTNGSGQQQQQQQYGQDPQHKKQAYASHEMTKDAYTVKHPGKIEHHIVDDQGNPKYSVTIDQNGSFVANMSDVAWNKT